MNLSVTAIGHDRPGIVAAITGALLEMDGNVDDSQMSILHGQFAVMLIVSVPDLASSTTPRTGSIRWPRSPSARSRVSSEVRRPATC